MKLFCPACKNEIPDKWIDLSEESAFCPQCQKDFACGDWIQKSLVTPEILHHPPDGAGFKKLEDGFSAWVSTRSYSWMLFLPAALFCSGILSYASWKMFIHPVHAVDPWGQLAAFIILTPFYFLTLYFWGAALMSVGGTIKVEVHGQAGTIFKGCGAIGWKRRFDWGQIEKIRIAKVYNTNVATRQKISLEGEKVVSFATGIEASRLRYIFVVLRLMHQNQAAKIVGAN